MTYETLDWEAEAKRIARAFGVSENCYFQAYLVAEPVENGDGDNFQLTWNGSSFVPFLPEHEGLFLWCMYHREKGRRSCVRKPKAVKWAGILMGCYRRLEFQVESPQLGALLAKGLFHLGLLSPEIEVGLKVSISAHQKLEWAREYEERYGV